MKHRWSRDEAGFEPSRRGLVGKCHSSISDEIATLLLHSGLVDPSFYDDEDESAPPDRIFNIYKGVPYVAVPTQPGQSYHGYPWRGRLPPFINGELEGRAKQEGTSKIFKKWMKEHG